MAIDDHQLILPPPHKLTRLRQMGLTYQEIGHFYDVPGRVIQNEFENCGVQLPKRQPNHTQKFWQKASTALALIRCGHRTYEALRQGLGYRSRSATHYFVEKLIALGWVTKTPGKAATLRLTPRAEHMGALIVPVRRQPNGDLGVCRYSPTLPSGDPR